MKFLQKIPYMEKNLSRSFNNFKFFKKNKKLENDFSYYQFEFLNSTSYSEKNIYI